MPNYWESLSNFKGAKPDLNSLTASQVKQHVETMEVVDNGAFLSSRTHQGDLNNAYEVRGQTTHTFSVV